MASCLLRAFRPFAKPAYPVGQLFNLCDLNGRSRFENETIIRALCANAYLGEGIALCRALGRYKLFIDTQDDGLSSHLLLDGYWEMWLTEVFAAIVKPAMTVIDVGANLGYFTMLLADLVGPGGHVHAFEPNVALARRLVRSVHVNGFRKSVTVHPQALSDGEGEFKLVIPPHEPMNAHIIRLAEGHQETENLVRTRRLDSYAELAAADVIKIDADTAEQAIWRGMSGILDSSRPITVLLEFSAGRYDDPGAFLDEISAHGFEFGYVAIVGGIQRATREQLLDQPSDQDLMLFLTRGPS